MAINESTALQVWQSVQAGGLDEDTQKRAAALLNDYRQQQVDNGDALFPSIEKQKADSLARLRGYFSDIKTVDAAAPSLQQVLPYSDNPDADRARVANIAYLAQRTGKTPEQIGAAYDVERNDYAARNFQMPAKVDDLGFYKAAGQEIQRQQQAENAWREGSKAALEGMGTLDAMASHAQKAMENPDKEQENKAFFQGYTQANSLIAPYAGLLKSAAEATSRLMDGNGSPEDEQIIKNTKETLMSMPGAQRKMAILALRLDAEKRGQAAALAKESGRGPMDQGKYMLKFFQQAGESAYRFGENALTDTASVNDALSTMPEKGEVKFSGAAISTPEEADKYVSEGISRMWSEKMAAQSPVPEAQALAGDERNSITLDEKASKLIRDAKARVERRMRIDREMNDIGSAADPVPNVIASTLGTSGAIMGVMAATRGAALPALASAYSNAEYNDLSAKYPGMSHQDKRQVAAASGAIQAALDYVGVKGFSKFNVGKLIANPQSLTASVAARGLVNAGMSYGVENLVEAGQDITTPALIQVLKMDAPGFDWEKEQKEFWKGRSDVAIGMLPLTLIGIGVASANDYANGQALLASNDRLGEIGLPEPRRVPILEEAQNGNVAKAEKLFREAFAERSPEIAAEYQAKLDDKAAQVAQVNVEATRLGLIPEISKDDSGWHVTDTATGQRATFPTWQDARNVATEHMNEAERRDADMVASMADDLLASRPSSLKQESINIRQRPLSLADKVAMGEITPESAMEAAVTSNALTGAASGMSIAEARSIAKDVFGESEDERIKVIRDAVNKLFILGSNTVTDGVSKSYLNDASPTGGNWLTVPEEIVEGRFKAGIESGRYSKGTFLNWVKMAEDATGERFLVGMTPEQVAASPESAPRALVEAVSRIVVADVLGRKFDGRRIGAGSISNNLDTQNKEKAWFVAWLKSFRRLFKQILATARKIRKARKEGKLGDEYDAYVDELLGTNGQIQHEKGAIKAAEDMANEALNGIDLSTAAPNVYSEEKPGPNGETFSIRSGDYASRIAAAFSPFQRTPELRLAIAQVAKARALKLGAEWIDKAALIRSSTDIDKEARMREALAYDTRMQEYLDGLTPEARQTLEQESAGLTDDPLISAMLDYGKLMSRSTAKKLGKIEAKSGDYDSVPRLPASWYSKGQGIMPDQMAQAMHDAGLLKDAYPDTLWEELQKRIASHTKNKAEYNKAQESYKAAEKYARDASRAEADQWAESAKKKAGSPKVQRDMLKAALQTLDAILSAAPPEVRAKVGGYVKLAGLATDEAMLKEIERRIEKLNTELEKWLKKEGLAQVEKLLKKGRPSAESGKKAKGKDADLHHLFAAAEKASKMDSAAVAGELARLDTLIAGDTLTPEQETLATTERGLVELLGDLKHADSGRIFSAIDTLRNIYDGAWLKWKLAEIERKERRAGMRQEFIDDTGKQGLKPERDAADKSAVAMLGKIKGGFLSLSSFHEVLAYAFGSESSRVKSLVDAERNASGQYEDANQVIADDIEALFTDMAGSVLAGERLRFDMAQRTIKTDKGDLSQLEAIQALLMWRQEDGRRHMEGQLDEAGKPVGKWHYNQAWIDEVTAALTPEAKRLMSFIMQKYGAEWATLNPLYRARYGVNLPAHDNYAPITVTPAQTKAGEVVDPVTGSAMSSGSILTPGSLRTRSRSAVAEPEFRDALQTLLNHTRQLEYWKAYYDLATEANAILGNREVMNAVYAKAGKPAATALRNWVDAIAQGGFRDASANLEINKALSRMTGRAATVGLLGRFSTLLVQSAQLAAAAVKMPLGKYLVGMSKLLIGNLSYSDAINSKFIQRRYKSAPPIVRQAMQNLGSAKRPNQITSAVRSLGQILSGADALFTAGTYALLLDYHRGTGAALGLSGAELEAHAHNEAERDTEQVAQPTRMATRSLAEITSTNPLAKITWAYASEARQKIALAAWAATKAKSEPAQFAKTMFLVFGVGGLMTQLLKNLWKEAKGDDDEKKWSAERLVMDALSSPLHGIPFIGALMNDGNMLSGASRLKSVDFKGDPIDIMRDVDTALSVLGMFNDTAAGVSALSHAGLDAAKVLENLTED